MDYRANTEFISSMVEALAKFGKEKGYLIIYMNDCPYPRMSSFTDTKHDIIYLNTNYYKQRELPFVLGHEIGHCLAESYGSDYEFSVYAKLTAEGKADYLGLYLLFKIYLDNYYMGGSINVENLIHMFSIPDKYLDVAKGIVEDYLKKCRIS